MSAPVLKQPAKYISELFQNYDWDPRVAIADNQYSRQYNIYQFSVAALITDTDNYWIQWGGHFDNPVGYNFQVYFNEFLVEVFSGSNLVATDNSFYIDQDNDILYIHIDYKPWRYFDAFSAIYQASETTFSTGPKDEINPSDNKYGAIKVLPRMKVPTLNNKLNNIISGVVTYNSFSIQIDNADGKYDDSDILKFFNTPMQVSKTIENAETIEDFNKIRYGIINDINLDFKVMNIKATDRFYMMDTEFCKAFTTVDYPNLPDENIDELMPVAWGAVKKVAVFQIDKDTGSPPEWIDYIILNPDYITAVSYVYDADGNTLTHSFDSGTGIVRVTELDGEGEVIEAECADVTGDTDNLIGEIVIAALERNENISYVQGIWDVTETQKYLDICATIGFYFEGGTTKELIKGILKNDIAFLIQKNNGLLTLRQWGQEYETHFIPFWINTKNPKKNFKDASKYFCSSVRIFYNKDYNENKYTEKYLDDSQEKDIFAEYRKSYTAPFKTDLLVADDREDLADRILDRFGQLRETLKVSVGVDTFEINLLDTINFEAYINDRIFSEYSSWIVKECDPGQDEIIVEGLEVNYLLSFDDTPAQIDKYYWGIDGDQVA